MELAILEIESLIKRYDYQILSFSKYFREPKEQADERLKKLTEIKQQLIDALSLIKFNYNNKDMLLAMFDLAQTMPENLTIGDKNKVINKFIDNINLNSKL